MKPTKAELVSEMHCAIASGDLKRADKAASALFLIALNEDVTRKQTGIRLAVDNTQTNIPRYLRGL